MSKNVAMFVDVANLYYSARGQDVDVDYVALLKTATKGRDLIRAYAYSGLDPENENQRKFIDFLNKNGYKTLTKDIRKFGDGRVKANLDIELVVDLFRLADRMDIAVIVSGDGDFAPAIRALQDKGVRCEVISFRPNTSSDLIAVADEFIDIMKIAGIGRGSKEAREQRGMSAPEMPAKEVVPEFGFREASPSVAKAALAALRDTRDTRESRGSEGRGSNGRGRGRGRSAAPAVSAEEPAEAMPAGNEVAAVEDGELAADADGRRRRRRRGGRGRGRGRSRAEQPETGEGEPGDIGWVELDDISQLSELEGIGDVDVEREYSFEEADASTLAELGITAQPDEAPLAGDAVTDEAQADEAPAKPARRRTGTRKSAQEAEAKDTSDAAASGQDEAPKKPARRRATSDRSARSTRATAKTEGEAAEGEATADAEAKPRARRSTGARTTRGRAPKTPEESPAEAADGEKPRARRSRTRTTKKDDRSVSAEAGAGAETEEGGQGIWQRFRSARGKTTT